MGSYVRFLLSLSLLLLLIWSMDRGWSVGDKNLPSIGSFLSPFHGFWQNADTQKSDLPSAISHKFSTPVNVVYDKYLIPHIYAGSEKDLFWLQGYITAKHRLWQMEMQTHAAAGRVAEILGRGENDVFLNYDKEQRNLGLPWAASLAAQKALEDPISAEPLLQYTAGVNFFIQSLQPKDYPLEYKLLNYAPELWTPTKTFLFQKYMAQSLVNNENDIEYTNLIKLLGKELFDELFPDHTPRESPIISNKAWDFAKEINNHIDNIFDFPLIFHKQNTPSAPNLGSNNWAVNGSKTSSKRPILCNDPHLGLQLPAVWFEMHLSCPTMNVYGGTLPGSPGVITGFNDSIAWGITAMNRDVKDWYVIDWIDAKRQKYQFGEQMLSSKIRVETYHIKNDNPVLDTIYFTHLGPIVSKNVNADNELAMRWAVHQPTNELATFIGLNKAKNYQDYVKAISTFGQPAQNFIFADKRNNIAMASQGLFPIKGKSDGKTIMPALPDYEWQGWIPAAHNPAEVNPAKNYVSSANQIPTDSSYPYPVHGMFDEHRGRIIQRILDTVNQATIESMTSMQNNSYNQKTADFLEAFLPLIDEKILSDPAEKYLAALKKWVPYYYAKDTLPVFCEKWIDALEYSIYDEIPHSTEYVFPSPIITCELAIKNPTHFIFDIASTDENENAATIATTSFQMIVDELINENTKNWGETRVVQINHLTKLAPLSYTLNTLSGHRKAINSLGENWGPSWKMIVQMTDNIEAVSIYPGGQSGNPASPYYANFIETWAQGKMKKVLFYPLNDFPKEHILQKIAY